MLGISAPVFRLYYGQQYRWDLHFSGDYSEWSAADLWGVSKLFDGVRGFQALCEGLTWTPAERSSSNKELSVLSLALLAVCSLLVY